tara:strand:- start:200 stop:646 length:447 start_codon:yes stop_codon:yes gene_type:complete
MFASLLLLTVMTAQAQDTTGVSLPVNEGKFTILDHRECAPFPGVLFDADATASLMALPNYYSQKCQLDMSRALGEQSAEYDLEIEQLNIRLDVLQQEHTNALTQKDLEITTLQDALKKNSKRNPWLWGTIGAVVGASLTVAIVETTRD